MAEKGLNCGINKTVIMTTKITVPDIGDFENVEIIEILAKPGAIIKKNDPIVTLESDKSSVEVPSPFSGKISSVEVKIGDKVSKGSVLVIISIISTFSKSPISGTIIFVTIITVLFIPQFNPFSAMQIFTLQL